MPGRMKSRSNRHDALPLDLSPLGAALPDRGAALALPRMGRSLWGPTKTHDAARVVAAADAEALEMRLLVCGGRTWRKRFYEHTVLDDINRLYGIDVVIEGCAPGADELAGDHQSTSRGDLFVPQGWAARRRVPGIHFPADWHQHGKAAGPIRNKQMLVEGKPDMVVAFHENFNQSKGTAHMIGIARKAGIPCYIFPHHDVDIVKIEEDGERWLDQIKSGAVI